MANAYIPPGVSVDEVVSPSFNAVLADETTVCIVGPSAGYQTYTETLLLNDNDPVTLSTDFADLSTITVYSAADTTADPYTESTSEAGSDNDYALDSSLRSTDGTVTIRRAMQTLIESDEDVTVYHENTVTPDQDDSFTESLTLSGIEPTTLSDLVALTQDDTISVQRQGIVPTADYTITGAGEDTVTLVRESDATVLQRFQTVWLDYDIVSNHVVTITVTGGPAGGSYTLTKGGQTTASIAHSASAGTFESAFEALSTVDDVNVSRTGAGTIGDPYVYEIEYVGSDAGASQSVITVTSSLTGGTSPGVTYEVETEGGVTTSYEDVEIQLDYNLGGEVDVEVDLADWSSNHVVKNASGASADVTAVAYSKGTSEDLDYMVDNADVDPTAIAVRRSLGTTSIGNADGKGQVKVVYQATPDEYWLATRVFSQADAEDKFGAPFNSDGTINSPLSFGSLLSFQAGAKGVVLQALYQEVDGERVAPTGAGTDWQTTFEGLRDYEDINVVVPLLSTGDLTSSDSLSLTILTYLKSHIQYMAAVGQLVEAVAGEDATTTGQGSPETLRSHATTLGSYAEGESMLLLSPGSFTFSNPITGQTTNIGGQYAACVFAGGVSARGISESMTRKPMTGLTGVNINRTEQEKNSDAGAGLCVIESKNGVVRVRHSITTAASQGSSTATQREFSVVRSKHFVIENIRQVLDEQVVGQIRADANAAFTVQVIVTNILDLLLDADVISDYDPAAVQVRRLSASPTTLEVRFSYQPLLPVNNISVKFALDTSTGDIIVNDGTQGG